MFRKKQNIICSIFFMIFLGMGLYRLSEAASIVNTKHNLSVSGYYTVKAATEAEICIFCHAPHNTSAAAPLWNRYDPGQTYIPYTSSTAKAVTGQPTDASKLCLSCHDGTLAIGMVRSRTEQIELQEGAVFMPDTRKRIGTDLSDDHPISFSYDSILASGNPELLDPSILTGSARLDKNGQMQCTTCHNPHNDQYGKFLVVDLIREELCGQCHNKTGWSTASHNVGSVFTQPNLCLNCHTQHAAGGKQRLLAYAAEEDNCYLGCHSVTSTKTNIKGEFSKSSRHPVTLTIGVHDPLESATVSNRHVECQDCHNPHVANNQDTPDLMGSLRGVKGINANGAELKSVSYEYEICFRCHSDTSTASGYVNRQFPGTNTRVDFDSANSSYHPVVNIGKNSNVPSLISPLTVNSKIKCTDCHNNNRIPTYPNGPHGSIYAPILSRQLILTDGQTESSANYALCYKCHDRNNILNDRSFSKHERHIVDEKSPCTACHDPHGVQNATHLINFDRNIVSPNDSGTLRFDDLGTFRGRCNLKCHNENHNDETY